MGRKTKLNKTLIADFERLLKKGVTDQDAYHQMGVSHTSFYNWFRQGEEALEAATGEDGEIDEDSIPPEKLIKVEFFEAVSRARRTALAKAALTIVKSATTGQRTVEEYTETRTESRPRKDGKSTYDITFTLTTKKVTKHPPDWRAALAYAQRRSPEEWSEKVEHSGSIALKLDEAYDAAARGLVGLLGQQSRRGDADGVAGDTDDETEGSAPV